jgi:hypothetical protein
VNHTLRLANSFKLRTYESPLPQVFYNQQLQTPFVSVLFTRLTSPLESTLTQSPIPNSFKRNTYKIHRGRHTPPRNAPISQKPPITASKPVQPPVAAADRRGRFWLISPISANLRVSAVKPLFPRPNLSWCPLAPSAIMFRLHACTIRGGLD